MVVGISVAVNLLHTASHAGQHLMSLPTWQLTYVAVVIYAAPVVAAILLRTRHRIAGAWLLVVSMAGSLVFGLLYHFLVPGPDNVFTQHAGNWRVSFGVTAVILSLLQVIGVSVGLWAVWRLSRPPTAVGRKRPAGGRADTRRHLGADPGEPRPIASRSFGSAQAALVVHHLPDARWRAVPGTIREGGFRMSDAEILVTGGSGVLGGNVVERLKSTRIEPRVLSHSNHPGTIQGDLLTGEGLEAAVRGVHTIVHCASSPLRKARRTDVEGTERLLEAAARVGVSHVVYISIVGIDRVRSYPYYRVKLETERVVEGSPIPYTILRATQFYDLVYMAVRTLARLPVVPVPKGLVGQAIDAGEVADRMVELALSEPAGHVPDIGGPEVMTLDDVMRSYLRLIESRKRMVALPLPGKTARAMRGGALTCPENRYGKVRWEEFLHEVMEESKGSRY